MGLKQPGILDAQIGRRPSPSFRQAWHRMPSAAGSATLIALNGCERLPRDSVCAWLGALVHSAHPGLDRSAEDRDLSCAIGPSPVRCSSRPRPGGRRSAPRPCVRCSAAHPCRPRLSAGSDGSSPAAAGALLLGRIPDRPAIAMVGSRAAVAYGLEAATLFARRLAEAGLTIVSGLARGVDTAAHRGALAASGGLTVGVLGCGLDVRYPTGTDRLRRQIAGRGAVITEFPLGTPPNKYNFPIRNRIIAALASGTLVVQGEARSGSLITARLALELGRDVYAVPGRIFDSRSAGPNALDPRRCVVVAAAARHSGEPAARPVRSAARHRGGRSGCGRPGRGRRRRRRRPAAGRDGARRAATGRPAGRRQRPRRRAPAGAAAGASSWPAGSAASPVRPGAAGRCGGDRAGPREERDASARGPSGRCTAMGLGRRQPPFGPCRGRPGSPPVCTGKDLPIPRTSPT